MRQVWLWRPGTIWKGGGEGGRGGVAPFALAKVSKAKKKEERRRGRREMVSLGGATLS